MLRRSIPSSSIANSLAFSSMLAVSGFATGIRNVPCSSRLYHPRIFTKRNECSTHAAYKRGGHTSTFLYSISNLVNDIESVNSYIIFTGKF